MSNKLTQISAPMSMMMIHSRKSDFWFCINSRRYFTLSETSCNCKLRKGYCQKLEDWQVYLAWVVGSEYSMDSDLNCRRAFLLTYIH